MATTNCSCSVTIGVKVNIRTTNNDKTILKKQYFSENKQIIRNINITKELELN